MPLFTVAILPFLCLYRGALDLCQTPIKYITCNYNMYTYITIILFPTGGFDMILYMLYQMMIRMDYFLPYGKTYVLLSYI